MLVLERVRLPDDTEPVLLAGRLLPLDLDPINTRRSRAAIAPAYQAPDRIARPLIHCLDSPIVKITNPSFDAGNSRPIAGGSAKVDALHPPINEDARSHPFHIPAPPDRVPP